MSLARRRGVEIAGQHHRHVGRKRLQPRQDFLRAARARHFVAVAVGQVGVVVVEAPVARLHLEQRPGDHARERVAPGHAARHVRRIGQPEIARVDHLQPIGAVEHAHVLVAVVAAAALAEPAVLRQLAHHVIALALVQLLRAEHVGMLLADRCPRTGRGASPRRWGRRRARACAR